VTFLRSSPPNPNPPRPEQFQSRIEGGWPIVYVASNADGTVTVELSRDDLSNQIVQLRNTARGWEIVSVYFVIA